MVAQAATTGELAYLAAQPPEIRVAQTADLEHIGRHAGTDEPLGTWTGGDCPRYGLAIGSDVSAADLLRLRDRAGHLLRWADFEWHPPEGLAAVYQLYVQGAVDDARREVPQWELGDWQHQIAASWSYAWSANCKLVAEVIEEPARSRGGAGLIVASFEHNSGEHGLAAPHVHNLVPMRD
jgi:hypothetical protein